MNKLIPIAAALTLAATAAWAKAPPDATGECKDGTYTTAAKKEGACSSHGGVKTWTGKAEKDEKAAKAAEKKEAAAEKKAEKKAEKDAKAAEKKEKAAAKAESAAAPKPADATGQCKDGTYTTSDSKSGACAGHKGVKTWYGKADAKSAAPAAAPAPAKPAASTKTSAPASTPATPAPAPASTKAATTPPSERTAAAGGGAGKVWVNTDSKVYHCEKDALYGKTKQGEYMTEAQAKASGARAARDKACS